jgi:hypothetical protein
MKTAFVDKTGQFFVPLDEMSYLRVYVHRVQGLIAETIQDRIETRKFDAEDDIKETTISNEDLLMLLEYESVHLKANSLFWELFGSRDISTTPSEITYRHNRSDP